MKASSVIIAIMTIVLISCDPPNKAFDPEYVKLNMTVNDTAEAINLGDTLKFKLTIPDTLNGISQSVTVNTLQEGFYFFTFYQVDTINRIAKRMTGSTIYVTDGNTDGTQVNVSRNAKPFTATLNIVPPSKGIYYVQITPQPGTIKVNGSYEAGLRVNFGVTDKHWIMMSYYYNQYLNVDVNAFITNNGHIYI
jgi:hypothetical protein